MSLQGRLFQSAASRLATLVALGLFLLAAAGFAYVRLHAHRAFTYRDHFATGDISEWKSYGGNWQTSAEGITNDSNESGAKLLTGRDSLTDVVIESDLRLTNHYGDAGLIFRVTQPEDGTNAFYGYYAAMRIPDMLVLARMDYGFQPLQLVRIENGVRPGVWYHLTVRVQGCNLSAQARDQVGHLLARAAVQDASECQSHGSFGLRSFAAGGSWRNVRVAAFRGPAIGHLSRPCSGQACLLSGAGLLPPVPLLNATPALPIAALRSKPLSLNKLQSVHGVVTRTGAPLYMQDRSGGIEVTGSLDFSSLRLGDEVTVTGYARPGRYASGFEAVHVRLVRSGTPAPPLSVTPAVAAMGGYDRVFIDTDGVLVHQTSTDQQRTFLLRGDHQTFLATLPSSRASVELPTLRNGSFVRISGICVMSGPGTSEPVAFQVLLRSPEDLEVIAGPPFWNRTHVLLLTVSLLLAGGSVLLVTRRIQKWQFALVLEERTRLAHDLHDTLAQNFAGIAFQLQALRSVMRRRKVEAEIDQHVTLAIGMVAHSHEDARRAIAMLRPNDFEGVDLLETLREQASTLTEGGEIRFTIEASGQQTIIPPAIRETLLRVGHEAITNSIRHASPTVIAMHMVYRLKEIEFTVSDDGCGFSPRTATVRGFGLAGMRSRVASLGGTLTVTSAPGHGCAVQACIPAGRKLRVYGSRRTRLGQQEKS